MSSGSFQKSEVNILDELGASVLSMDLADLVRMYGEHDYEFGRLWTEHLLRRAGPLPPEDRAVYVDVAYDVYDTTRAILLHKDVFWRNDDMVALPLVGPRSRFRKGLLFNALDFFSLRSEMKWQCCCTGWPKWYAFWRRAGLGGRKTVAECVEYVFENRESAPRDPSGGVPPDFASLDVAAFPSKSEVDILAELGASVLSMDPAELLREYARRDVEFGELWTDHLLRTTEPLPPEERAVFVNIAFDVYDTTRAMLRSGMPFRAGKEEAARRPVGPDSRFREDLLFKDGDFVVLRGAVRAEHITLNRRKWYKFWSKGEFYELRTVADCVRYVYENRMLWPE